MYRIDTKVRYSECDSNGQMKLTSIINWFQDSSSEHSEVLNVGIEYLKEKKRAWILNSWQIVINRYPKVYEEIEITTWASGFKGVFGPRNFCMKTKDGEMLVYANTLWVYMDTEKGRPVKPSDEEKEIYAAEPPLDMEYAPRKIDAPEGMQKVEIIPVRKYYIDTNGHVNNSQYVQVASEVLPEGFVTKQLRVEYKKSAVYGDQFLIKMVSEEEKIVVELCDMDEIPYAVVEFIGEQ